MQIPALQSLQAPSGQSVRPVERVPRLPTPPPRHPSQNQARNAEAGPSRLVSNSNLKRSRMEVDRNAGRVLKKQKIPDFIEFLESD